MDQDSSRETVRTNPDVVARRLGTGAVLVHLRTNQIFELNNTAARVWELTSAGLGLEEVAATLAQEFEVSIERAASDILPVLALFRAEGFLQ